MMTKLAMACNWSAAVNQADEVYCTPLSLFIAMSCLAIIGFIYSAGFIVFNVVYRNDRY